MNKQYTTSPLKKNTDKILMNKYQKENSDEDINEDPINDKSIPMSITPKIPNSSNNKDNQLKMLNTYTSNIQDNKNRSISPVTKSPDMSPLKSIENARINYRAMRKETMTPSFVENTVQEGTALARPIPQQNVTIASKYMVTMTSQYTGDSTEADSKKLQANDPLKKFPSDKSPLKPDITQKELNECFLKASQCGDLKKCREYLTQGNGSGSGGGNNNNIAEINYRGLNGWHALHYATFYKNQDLVEMLIAYGADFDAITDLKYSPLMLASQQGYDQIAELLINVGADINLKDHLGNTALHLAVQSGSKRIVEILLRKPSLAFNAKNNEDKCAYDLQCSIEIKALFDTFIKQSKTNNDKGNQYNVKIHVANLNQVDEMFKNYNDYIKGSNSNQTDIQTLSTKNESTAKNSPKMSILSTSSSNSSTDDEKLGPENFIVFDKIGGGSFGHVFLVERKNTKMLYAMKVLYKQKVNRQNILRYVVAERNILSYSNHPFIVKLHFAFQTHDKFFLILDYCPGGDLSEHLDREKRFSEEKARFYLCEIILAIEDLHKRDIIFRDLKPENVVIDEDGHARITDFGLSKEGVNEVHKGAQSFCGSPAYLAPEMLRRSGHGKAVDWYLVGVIFYEMIVGIPPYYSAIKEQLFYNIDKAPLRFPHWISSEAMELCSRLLDRNPIKRLGSGILDAEEIKCHRFFKGVNWKDVYDKVIKPPFIPPKKEFLNTKLWDHMLDRARDPRESIMNYVKGWSFINQNAA